MSHRICFLCLNNLADLKSSPTNLRLKDVTEQSESNP